MRERTDERKEYEKPRMTTMRINRFFLGGCQNIWPYCYSMYLFIPGAARCR